MSNLYTKHKKLYRIVQTKNNITSIISNCDDDGETGAGSRMLFLMKVN